MIASIKVTASADRGKYAANNSERRLLSSSLAIREEIIQLL